MDRVGAPREVADAVLYLASDDARWCHRAHAGHRRRLDRVVSATQGEAVSHALDRGVLG